MSILEGIRNILTAKKIEDVDRHQGDTVDLERDGEGEITASEFVAYVKREIARRKTDRATFELQWLLNSNFLSGHQYCDINPNTEEIDETETEYDYEEKGVYNRIAPLYDTRMSHLRNVRYNMTVRPATIDIEDQAKADVSTSLLRYTQRMVGWDKLKDRLYGWAELTGTAFVLSYWDRGKGRQIAECNGSAIYEGDLCCGILSPYEVFPESIYKEDVEEQANIIVDQVMDVSDIFDKFNISVDGMDVSTYVITPITGAGSYGLNTFNSTVLSTKTAKKRNAGHVIQYFEKPSRRYPSGRLAIIINDSMIFYGALPYDRIPIVSVKCKAIPGVFFGKSFIQELIPLQRAYNGCKNALHDYIKTAAGEPIMIPEGSVEDVDDLIQNGIAPNQFIFYRPEHGKPEHLSCRGIPSELLNEIQTLSADMEYAAGISQLMVYGATPGGVTSGTAIENLRQIDNTRLSLTSENMRVGVKELAEIWLSIYKRHATGMRVVQTTGMNSIGSVLTWCADDINSYDVVFDTENELIYSEEQQKQNFIQAYQMGLFADENGRIPREVREKALELMKVHQYTAIMSINDEQRRNAQTENGFFEAGILPEIDRYDDHEIHIAEHKRYALQYRFKQLRKRNAEMCELFDRHIQEHEQILAAMERNSVMAEQAAQAAERRM